MVLRDVSLRIEQVDKLLFRFDGSAHGDSLEELHLSGTVDLKTGRASLSGKLNGLTLSDALRRRIPREVRPMMNDLGLTGGVIDIDLKRASYDAEASASDRVHYAMSAWLREGVWECPRSPFPSTSSQRSWAWRTGWSPSSMPRDSTVRRPSAPRERFTRAIPAASRWTCTSSWSTWSSTGGAIAASGSGRRAEYDELWDVFQPHGLVNAQIDLVRTVPDGPVELGAKVTCKDVAAKYRHFAYQLDHLRGQLELRKKLLTVDVQTLSVGGRPLRLKGTIKNPGVEADVALELTAESVPIEEPLLKAFEPEVQKVVAQFEPKGTVRAHAKVSRKPMDGTARGTHYHRCRDRPERAVRNHDGPSYRYPIRNLTGRLELAVGSECTPTSGSSENMRGENGQAKIHVSGRVEKLPETTCPTATTRSKSTSTLNAKNLPFSQELRTALAGGLGQDVEDDQSHGRLRRRGHRRRRSLAQAGPHAHRDRAAPESSVRLEIVRAPQPKHFDPGDLVELRMDDVRGRFIFDNGTVTMSDVSLQFRGAPVQCDHGTVFVEDSGRFGLSVTDLWVKDIRLDLDLHKKMPPLMAQFAQRAGRWTDLHGPGELENRLVRHRKASPPGASGTKTLVVFNDNRLSTGIPLEHIQGELNNVSGWSNGLGGQGRGHHEAGERRSCWASRSRKVKSPFRVQDGVAELVDLRGGSWAAASGAGAGSLWIHPELSRGGVAPGAELRNTRGPSAARSLPRQHRCPPRMQRPGERPPARSRGREKPTSPRETWASCRFVFRIASLLNPTRTLSDAPDSGIKTAFDSADVAFTISHGLIHVGPDQVHRQHVQPSGPRVPSTPRPSWTSASGSSSAAIDSPSRSSATSSARPAASS